MRRLLSARQINPARRTMFVYLIFLKRVYNEKAGQTKSFIRGFLKNINHKVLDDESQLARHFY